MRSAAQGFDGPRRRSERLSSDKSAVPVLSNALVHELVVFMTSKKLPWSALHTWIAVVLDSQLTCSVNSLTAKVRRLQAARSNLLKVSDHKALSRLLSEEFTLPEKRAQHVPDTELGNECDNVFAEAGASSAVGVAFSDDSLGDVAHVEKSSECSKLEERLRISHNKVRNLGKKLRRRDEKPRTSDAGPLEVPEEDHESVVELEGRLESALETVDHLKRKLNNAYCRATYERTKTSSAHSAVSCVNDDLDESRQRVKELEGTVEELEAQLDLESSFRAMHIIIEAKVEGRYTPEVRQCCYELLAKNVGVWNVGPVIRSVLHLAKMDISDVPSPATLSQMLVELRQISQLHVASAVVDSQYTTSHSDGTSKQGVSYQ